MLKKKKNLKIRKPFVNKELEGLDFSVNTLGKIKSTYEIDKINEFLNAHVEDDKIPVKKISNKKARED